MANVLIEENTLKAIGNAIRAKTGKTDLILPKDMEVEIGKITGGSGNSSDLVKYVTFMNEDGTTELFKMPVLSGDDCKDPVSHGDITTPTKESTNTTNYAHNGWALASGGSADSSALKNVTEDRIVYASFAESVRYYTVNFYTEVGALYETVQVTYGATATPSKNPEKSGYIFDSWSPSNKNITTNTDCYAVWMEGLDFAASPWTDIARVCEAGEASKYFKVGDVREVTWTNKSGATITTQFQIVGIDHDNLADGSGKAGLSIMSVPLIDTRNYVKTANPTLPGRSAGSSANIHNAWSTCDARTVITNDFYPLLPNDLTSHIKEVTKISTKDTGNIITHTYISDESTDKVWIPSITEMTGSNCDYAKIPQGIKYPIFVDNAARIKYEQGTDGAVGATAQEYGTRSLSGYAAGKIYSIKNTGGSNNQGSQTIYKFPIGFCI